LIDIQPWFGNNLVHAAYDHCYKKISSHRLNKIPATKLWGSAFDTDEFLVLKNHTCIAKFVENKIAPGIY
jgi:hypothetical protein